MSEVISEGEEQLKRLYLRFYRAACRRDAETVAALVRDHPELHDYKGQAGGLLDVLVYKAPELMETALQAGLSPDSGTAIGSTLLQSAAADGDLERLRLLIRYGADLERRNAEDEVALGYACAYGHLEAARLLIEAGADVNAVEVSPENGVRFTPLDACLHKYPELVEYLRSQGAKRSDELDG
jgi:ankyrin repeat protein